LASAEESQRHGFSTSVPFIDVTGLSSHNSGYFEASIGEQQGTIERISGILDTMARKMNKGRIQ
jgi:hypothetical protein